MSIQFTLAARYLLGRKLRTFLTTLAVIFGVMIIFGLNGMLPAFTESFHQNMLAAAGKVDLAITSDTGETFDIGILDTVRSVEGVAHATGSLRHNVVLPPGSPVNAVTVAGLDPATAREVRQYALVAGRFLQAGDANVMVIPENLLPQAGLALGDMLTLPSSSGSTDFKIVGIITTRALPGVEEVYVPLDAAQTLFNQPGRINTIEAMFASGVDRGTVEAAVRARLDNGYKLGELQSGSELLATMKIGEVAINLFGLMALAMGGFIIFNTFRTVVAERRRDLGMLRAVGASRRTILGIIISEGLLQGIFGTAMGMAAGYGLTVGLLAFMAPIAEKYVHFRFGGPVFTPPIFIASIALGVGVTLLGGLFPAISASRVTPLDALRPTVGEVYLRAAGRGAICGAILIVVAALGLVSGQFHLASLGALLFIIGLVLVAPVLVKPIATVFGRLLALVFAREGQIAQGNMIRQPGRAAITASAMMIGLAILIALAGTVSSLFSSFMGYLDKSLGADFFLMPQSLMLAGGNMGAGPELARNIRETPGIATVTSLRLGTSKTKGAALQIVGIDPATYPTVAGLEFIKGDEAKAYAELAAGQALIVNGIFAAQNNVKVGDTLTLKTPEDEKQYRVVGIGVDYLNAKLATGYISQANLERDFHQTNDLLLMANKQPEAAPGAVHAALEELVKDYPGFTLFASAEWRATQEQAFASSMGMLYILMTLLALPSLLALVNTLAINVIERTREIGMIRAVGGTQRQVQRMILAESLLLAVAGTAFGIMAGLWLGYVLVGAMNVSGFIMPYYFPYTGLLVTTAIGLLIGVAAAVLPARQAAKLDIVRALHYE